MKDKETLVEVVTSEIVVEEHDRYKAALKDQVKSVRNAKRTLKKEEKKLQELTDMSAEEYADVNPRLSYPTVGHDYGMGGIQRMLLGYHPPSML